jgi:hypothetical protein|tara:strand:+ start:23360 stop:23476 length:117 start_codon:yes stop_codon:yes gene_type:complete
MVVSFDQRRTETIGIIAVGRGMFVNEDDAKFVPCQRAM